jgi:exodeoxyribonuclease-5
VRFENEDDLEYCEVKPLLRLPERKLQMERGDKA